jgi:hypothetical protein
MEKKIQFELVLRAKDTTIHDEKTGFYIVDEVACLIEADWNHEKPNLSSEAILAMTQHATMTHMSKHFIDAVKNAPLGALFVSLVSKVTTQLRKAPPPTCPHGKTVENGCHDCFIDDTS